MENIGRQEDICNKRTDASQENVTFPVMEGYIFLE
jgi:hypothetical protein